MSFTTPRMASISLSSCMLALRTPLSVYRAPLSSTRHLSSSAIVAASPRRRRASGSEPPRSNADLVAPPDPTSNIRPVIYASISTRPPSRSSPYATLEFPYTESDSKLQDLELEWRLRRERVDMMNHRFWATTNAEFNAQLAHRLAELPPASDPPTEQDERLREDCLAKFYADWQATNRERQTKWVKTWWRELWDGLKMHGRVHVARLFRKR